MKQIDRSLMQYDLLFNHIAGGAPSYYDNDPVEVVTTERGLNVLIKPAFPFKPAPPFIKHTVDETKEVIIAPKLSNTA